MIALLSTALIQPCFAARWQDLGNMGDSLDKVYIDADSVELLDGFRIVRLMVVYPSPRTDKNDKTTDRYIQRTVVDCERKLYYGIQTIWYLNDRQVVASPSATDWKTKTMHIFSDNPMGQRLHSAACNLPLTTGKQAPADTPPDIQHPAPARSTLLDGENLLFAPPKDFIIGHHSDRIGSLTEYIPSGETVENWTEMLTIQIFRNLKDTEPSAFLQQIGAKWLNDCPETPKDTIHNGKSNGYPVSMLELKCPNVHSTGKPETTIFRVIKGKDALYSIQYAWRTVPSDGAKDALSKTTVCDTRDPSHSCPSFDSIASPGPASIPAPTPAPAHPKLRFLTGSGIIVNDEGYILTSAHVVKSCKSIAVKAANIDALSAKLEVIDPKNDLALLKTSAGYGLPAQFRSESKPAKLGETIGVIGYPLTDYLSAEPKATFGQINSVAGLGNDYTLLQISAPIQSGNSGGPVIDTSGNVIAIVVSRLSLDLGSKSGDIPQNVNFAIRGELAQIFMQAHGVKFKVSDHKKELRTDQIAEAGQKSTALVVCSNE